MNLLLDTHIVLWWLKNDTNLAPQYRGIIAAPDNICHVSAATIWEISIKEKIGKLKLPKNYIDELHAEGFVGLPVTWNHAQLVSELPLIHRDPFDRLLIAQAKAESLTLLSVDEYIKQYNVRVL